MPAGPEPSPSDKQSGRNWRAKFGDAVHGVRIAFRSEKSFAVHAVAAVLVVVVAAVVRVTWIEWCLLLLCIASVFAAETFNSAIESLAKAVTAEHNEHVGRALDAAAGAVLLTAIGSACVGTAIFLPYLLALLGPDAE